MILGAPPPVRSILGVLWDNSREAMASTLETSLKYLRTDHVDTHLTHLDDRVHPSD